MELFKLFATIAIRNNEANNAIDDTTGKAEKSESKISSAFKKIGTAVVSYFAVDKIKDFGLACINAASDLEATGAQFSQVFGDLEDTASKNLSAIADSTGVVENRMKGSYTKIAAFAKTTGMDTADALGLADRAMVAIADSAAFYDRTLEETTESLQSFLKGNYENDAALGLSCTETTRNAAANQLYGKSFKDLSEQQKQLTLLQMVEDANKLSGAMGQSARETDTWTNQTGNLKQALEDFKANIGSTFLDGTVIAVKKASEAVQWLSNKFSSAREKFKEISDYTKITLAPAFDNLKETLKPITDAVQPLIDKFKEYVTSGEASADATDAFKDAIDKTKDAINNIAEKGREFNEWISENKELLFVLGSAIAGLAVGLGVYNAVQAIKAAMNAAETVSLMPLIAAKIADAAATMAAVAPYMLIAAAIAAVIAIIVLCVKHWDEIKAKVIEVANKIKDKITEMKDAVVNKFQEMKNKISEKVDAIKSSVSEKFNAVKEKIISPIENAKEKIKNIVDTIKGFFSSMKLSFPNIKLPHFKINPSGWKIGDLLQGSIPKLAIDWYDKAMDDGMILNKPTIFGVNSKGQPMGGGETGSETVVGTQSLMNMINNAVGQSNNSLYDVLDKILTVLKNIDNSMYDKIVAALQALGIEFDERELARLVKKYA